MMAATSTLVLPTGGESTRRPGALDVVEWLVGDASHDLDEAGLIGALGSMLRGSGMPIDRLTLHLRTLHPRLLGRGVAWAPGEPVDTWDREYGAQDSFGRAGAALRRVMGTGRPVTIRLTGPTEPPPTDGTDPFIGRGLVEAIMVPLLFADGLVNAASFSTARPGGFSQADRATLERIVPALRTACELRSLGRTEVTLLDTYLGATTARRVIAGHVRRGELETLEAGLMLCDLRGFTELSNRLPKGRVLDLLNAYFDRVVPAVTAAGGEIVKFMGDAVLAFFHRDSPAQSCAAALAGARGALEAMRMFKPGDATLSVGIALHYGEVGYGNIGSGERLDFTVIGPDVNLVSRIQGVCSVTGRPLLMSERFAKLLEPGTAASEGFHDLAGFDAPAKLYSLGDLHRRDDKKGSPPREKANDRDGRGESR